ATAETLRQLQETVKRLQAEISTLQVTIKQLSKELKKKGPERASRQPEVVVVPASPPAATTDLQRALAAYNQGRHLEDEKLCGPAIQSFSEAIQRDARNELVFLHRGYCYDRLGDHQAAIADFDHSLAVQPDNSRAYLARAVAHAAIGQNAQAMGDVNEAI